MKVSDEAMVHGYHLSGKLYLRKRYVVDSSKSLASEPYSSESFSLPFAPIIVE